MAYGIYAAFALLSFVFVRWVITETKGHELEDMPEEIKRAFRSGRNAVAADVLTDEPGRPCAWVPIKAR